MKICFLSQIQHGLFPEFPKHMVKQVEVACQATVETLFDSPQISK